MLHFLACILVGLPLCAGIGFDNGVASFDPGQSEIVIWTRYMPSEGKSKIANVHWQVSKDQAFSNIVQKGKVFAKSTRDWTVHQEVKNLSSFTTCKKTL